uniref:Uncharacterized protein n=1 Tax=Magnetococcus massalia (strain MO-1) TaxID=451514 RepID=A0A1S7LM51_MAGMO|nr:Protein of unknown function. Containing restriction endonuclease, type I, S subunit, EcoBI domain and nucleotidyltransferase domain [Candidatus Magnetococcus massalia]
MNTSLPKIDITPSQRKTVLALLERYIPNTETWVYGSRVTWRSSPKSDLDMVVFSVPDQKHRVADLKEAFEESSLPFRVDLFIWDEVPEQFRKQIEGQRIILQESKAKNEDGLVIPIFVPKPLEQKAIAHILGSLDDKIELNRRMNETLEAMAQALFKSWFVDFDPVIDNALAAGHEIPKALKARAATRQALSDDRKPLPEEIRQLFPSSFEFNEEMGWVPEGWEVNGLNQIIELAYGKSLSAKVRVPGNIPVYGSGGISGCHDKALVEGPGIVVGRKGTVGSVHWIEGDFFPIDTVFYVKLKKDIPLFWVYRFLLLMDIKSLGADSAVPGVNRNAVLAQPFVFPEKSVLDEYSRNIGPQSQKRDHLAQENNALESLRGTLLPKLLSGEIRIPDAEKLVEEVL